MFVKVGALVISYALALALVGWVMFSLTYTFDTTSLNPSLVGTETLEAPPDNLLVSEDNHTILCDRYGSAECNWQFWQDYETTLQLSGRVYPETLLEFRQDRDEGKIWAMTESTTNETTLVRAEVTFASGAETSCTDVDLAGYPSTEGVTACGYELTSARIYTRSIAGGISDIFSAYRVLVTNDESELLCDNYYQNCKYFEVGNFTYRSTSDTNDNQINTISAKQLLVDRGWYEKAGAPADRGTPLCTVDSGDCLRQGINPDGSRTGSFLFKDSDELNQNLLLAEIALIEVTSSDGSLVTDLNDRFQLCSLKQNSAPGGEPMICTQGGEDWEHLPNVFWFGIGSRSFMDPKIVVQEDINGVKIKIAQLTQGETHGLIESITNVLSNPFTLIQGFEFGLVILAVVIVLIFLNLFLAIFVSKTGLWRRVGRRFSSKFALLLQGRFGRLLELTQFFDLGGEWYLEELASHGYDFDSVEHVAEELLAERWRDTFYFPTALSAVIALLLVTLTGNPFMFASIIVIAPLMPLILSFWTPFIWTLQDAGLKRVEWSTESGDVLIIQRISDILRDGFDKLVGISALFGIGTAGASAFRSQFTQVDSNVLSAGLDSILSLNVTFLVSSLMWTVTMFFLVSALNSAGFMLSSLAYLNGRHVENVQHCRTSLQEKDLFLGTTQQVMNYHQRDTSIYFDGSTAQMSEGRAGGDVVQVDTVARTFSVVMPPKPSDIIEEELDPEKPSKPEEEELGAEKSDEEGLRAEKKGKSGLESGSANAEWQEPESSEDKEEDDDTDDPDSPSTDNEDEGSTDGRQASDPPP